MKFNCLNNQTVVEAKASDHHPIIMGDICVFNLLCRCEFKSHYANNGFSISEIVDAYRDRLLNKLIPVISELIEAHHVQIFALQEAPPMVLSKNVSENERATFEIAQEFYQKLKKLYGDYVINSTYYKSMWGGLDSCGLFLIHKETYKVQNEITQEMIGNISPKNKLRFQAFQLVKYNDKFKLVNIHADFNNQDGTVDDIKNLVRNNFIVAGDFNLKIFPQIEKCTQNVKLTEPGLMPYDTYDGILTKD